MDYHVGDGSESPENGYYPYEVSEANKIEVCWHQGLYNEK